MPYPWADRAFPVTQAIRVGAANGAVWAMEYGGSTGRSWRTLNGIDWSQMGDMPANANARWTPPAYAPSISTLVCAAGNANGGATSGASSTDGGATWTQRTLSSSVNWWSVEWSPTLSLFCACAGGPAGGTATFVATSPTGATWTNRTIANGTWVKVLWLDNVSKFYIVGSGSVGRLSTDGVDFSTVANHGLGTCHDGAYSPTLGLAVVCGPSGIKTSPDGATWTTRTYPAGSAPTSVCWDAVSARFVMGCQAGSSRVLVSDDGITWTSETIPTDRYVYSIAAIDGAPVGTSGDGGSTIPLAAANVVSGATVVIPPFETFATGLGPLIDFGTPRQEFTSDASSTGRLLQLGGATAVAFAPPATTKIVKARFAIKGIKFGVPRGELP